MGSGNGKVAVAVAEAVDPLRQGRAVTMMNTMLLGLAQQEL